MRCVHGVCNYINRFSFLISWLYKLYILDIEHWFTVSTCRCIGSRYNKLHEHLWVSIHGTVILLGLMISGWDSVVCRVGTVTNVCYYKVTKWCLTNQAFKSSILFTAQHRHKEQAIPKISDIEKLKKVRVMKVSVSCYLSTIQFWHRYTFILKFYRQLSQF